MFVAVAALMLATAGDFGLTWDEGDHIMRIEGIHAWCDSFALRRFQRWTSTEMIERHWKFAREEPHGHPPFYAILGYAGWLGYRVVTGEDGSCLVAYRAGPCVGFALAVAVVTILVGSHYGLGAGLAAAVAIVLTPRLFAHGHFMNTDCALVLMWVLTTALFVAALRRPFCAGLFGIALGLAAVTKLTGWFVGLPLAVWTLVYRMIPATRDRLREGRPALLLEPILWFGLMLAPVAGAFLDLVDRTVDLTARGPLLVVPAIVWLIRLAYRNHQRPDHWARRRQPAMEAWLAALAFAPLAMWLATPNFWHDPVEGIVRFLRSNLTRRETISIATYYLGETHAFSLPWHNTLVLTVATTPLGILILAAVGVGRAVRRARTESIGMLLLLSAGTLLVLRALPGVPGHDGVRQFITAFAFLAMLAGVGAASVVGWYRRAVDRRWHHHAAIVALVVLVAAGAMQMALVHPYELAYYGEAVGSLPGARALGLETTYYWDTISPELLRWVNAGPKPAKVVFPTYPRGWAKLHRWGMLADDVTFGPLTRDEIGRIGTRGVSENWQPAAPDFYVLQMRQASFTEADWQLVRSAARPAFAIRRFGVTLLAVYRWADLPADKKQELTRKQEAVVERIRTGRLAGPKW